MMAAKLHTRGYTTFVLCAGTDARFRAAGSGSRVPGPFTRRLAAHPQNNMADEGCLIRHAAAGRL